MFQSLSRHFPRSTSLTMFRQVAHQKCPHFLVAATSNTHPQRLSSSEEIPSISVPYYYKPKEEKTPDQTEPGTKSTQEPSHEKKKGFTLIVDEVTFVLGPKRFVVDVKHNDNDIFLRLNQKVVYDPKFPISKNKKSRQLLINMDFARDFHKKFKEAVKFLDKFINDYNKGKQINPVDSKSESLYQVYKEQIEDEKNGEIYTFEVTRSTTKYKEVLWCGEWILTIIQQPGPKKMQLDYKLVFPIRDLGIPRLDNAIQNALKGYYAKLAKGQIDPIFEHLIKVRDERHSIRNQHIAERIEKRREREAQEYAPEGAGRGS